MKSILAMFMAAVLCLTTIGCGGSTTSNLVTALNAVADAASVAVVVTQGLVSTGTVSQADATLVATYSTAISTAASQSITELGTTDTNVVKIGKITADFAAVVAPNVPGGAAIAPLILAITSAVQIFMSQLNSAPVVAAAKAAPHAPVSLVLSGADKTLLKKTQATAASTVLKANVLKASVAKK